ncbi:immune inhibitor A domain-containing protein [Peterkaempfera bronchialis]|uniref:immune inhibitor A domain-containing protein n=1 Tax=Peterkaempfera bronchialis TaxID=2126346 RepID=UPI003C2D1D7F
MKTTKRAVAGSAAAALIAALAAATLPGTATAAGQGAAPVSHDPADVQIQQVDHDLPSPLGVKQEAERKSALEQLLKGTAKIETHGRSKSIKLGRDKYVELARERNDKIFTILVEFGDQVDNTTMYDPDGPGPKPPVVKYGGTPGPTHNQIAGPDRKNDNSTAWKSDYNQKHYQDLYFSKTGDSLKTYYEKQSSGRYSVDGVVSDWVKVPWNEARYGSDFCGSHVCTNAHDLIRDAVNIWTADQKAKGRTAAQIKADLASYDQWDRYDYNGDGNFDEPDGYIDHFQIVHAGEDQSAGGGVQGDDALWAHRWYAYSSGMGTSGPDFNKLGGTQIGDTGMWVGDYTMQPENGGLGVFAHEYGHDLGLPDLYDTQGPQDNSVGFWSLMSSGSWLGDGKDSIGDKPNDLDVWSKLQLGWLNYDTAKAGKTSAHLLGPAEYNSKRAQGLLVELPTKKVTTAVNTPAAGSYEWWSGAADDLNVSLTRDVDLTGRTSATLTAKGWYEIEQDYDFGYAEASTDGGASWTVLDGTYNGKPIPHNEGGKAGLTGQVAQWGDLAFPLDAYAGKAIKIRFHYVTDGGLHYRGLALDDIAVTADGTRLFIDGAENGDNGWTANGFQRITGSVTNDYAQYYLAENRQYVSYDTTLKTGPYNFGFASRPDWVEHFPYQNGLLVWYWDTSQADNNVSAHPGQGLVLPVDAHAKPLKWADGSLMRTRFQGYDSTFGLEKTDKLTLHKADVATTVPSQPGVPVFNDHKGTYWYADNPYNSVKVPDTRTSIEVLAGTPDKLETLVLVTPAR